MDKKRENILFPLGFNSLPITAFAYNMRLKTEVKDEVDRKLDDLKKQLETDFNTKLEKLKQELTDQIKRDLETDLRSKIYKEVCEKVLEDIRRHDGGWERVDSEPEK